MLADKKNILLVEDELIVAALEKKLLEKAGYSITHVTSGEDAIRHALDSDGSFDAVLMDIDLGPGIDGTRTAEEILKAKDLPVIFLSSHTEPEIVEKTEKITSYGYVVKNSGFVVLEASIKMALKLFAEKIERKRAEEALRDNEEKLSATLRSIADAVISCDINGAVSGLNPAAEKLTGWTSAGAAGRPVEEVFHIISSVTRQKAKNPVFRSLKEGAIVGLANHTALISKSGEEYQIADSCAPIRNAAGAVVGAVLVFRDVTDEYRQRDELLKTKLIIENVPTGFYLYHLEDISDDRTLRMTYANQAVRDLTGLGPEVVVGKTLDENFPGLRAQGIPQRYAEVVRSQTAATFEDIIYGDDRMVRASFWVKAFPLPGGHVGVAFDNITERRRSEDLIREQEAFKSKMVENIGDVIVIIDSEGLNAYKSPNIERIFGWKPEEVVGKSTWDNVHPDDLEFGRRFIQDLLEEPGRVGTAEVRYKCRDGSFKWIEFTGSNLFNDPGIKGILGNYHDITERKAAVEEVKRQLAEKEVLLREVHHRVKNNIATVEGLLSFQADSTESPEAKAALQDSISRVRSICVLYDKLLLTTDYREISFRNYIESLLDSISAVFVEGRRFVVKKQIADFTIDSKKAVHVGIIINELMTNVFKYAFVGRDNGVISISVEKDGNAATLVIQDNGVGIDEKITSNGSPGLGFTIVKMMVKQLKGTYSAVNENGTRSTIRFEI